jgi:hypothetical protein
MKYIILEIHPDDPYFNQKDELIGKEIEVLKITNCYKDGVIVIDYKGIEGKIDNEPYIFYGIKFEVIPEELNETP